MNRIRICAMTTPALIAGVATAQTPGFTEDFNGSPVGYGGGSFAGFETSGGVGGDDDGFMRLENATLDRFGAFASGQTELLGDGDLLGNGVTGASFFLSELSVDDGTEMHVGVGIAQVNFWLSVEGFDPAADTWSEFSVDFTDESDWIQIIGSGTFEDAISGADRLLFRHDVAPFAQLPDPIAAEIGVDRITLLPAPGSVALLAGAGLLGATRRRR